MSNTTEKKQPFTWEAFEAMAAANPDLDILTTFSFEHLYGDEMEAVVRRAFDSTIQLKASLAYSYRLLEHLARLQLRELTPKAGVVPFPGSDGSTLQ